MTSSGKVDVIMPVRNGAKYIFDSLQSLLPEAPHISRLIIVDDGSTDETLDIIAGFEAPLNIALHRQPPLGIVAALNAGLQVADTPFVARMDADDVCIPGRLQKQIEFLESNPHIAVVGTQAAFIDGYGKLTGKTTKYPTVPEQVYERLFNKGCVVCHPTVLARREAILESGAYRAALEYAEDYDLWLRMSEKYNVTNLPDILLKYRVHPEQSTRPHNPRQTLSRDLAVWCARMRRAGAQEPAELLERPATLSDFQEGAGIPTFVRQLAESHAAVDKLAQEASGDLRASDLSQIISFARQRYLGGSRKGRYRILRKVTLEAMKRGHWGLAFRGLLSEAACRFTDNRLYRRFASTKPAVKQASATT